MPVMLSNERTEPWKEAPTSTGATREMTEGITRRMRAKGEHGMFVQEVHYRPGKVVRPHSHNRAQIFYIVAGSGQFDDGTSFETGDIIQVPARNVYGFTASDQGIRLLIVRTGEAKLEVAAAEAETADATPTPS
jgi:quercetin dioxygenase-like cupin family protein